MVDVWKVVHAERASLVAFLERVPDERWATPSPCEGWTVHDVVAHLVDCARTDTWHLAKGLARARFDLDRQNQQGLEHEKGTPAETLQRLREVVPLTKTPPVKLETRLVEAFAHGEDVRRPLGGRGEYPADAMNAALGYLVGASTKIGGGRQRVEGLRVEAPDTGFAHGAGPTVTGPASSLLLVLSGRRAGLDELEGDGTEVLAAR
ncbi:maleylpyruvate isomerase family mycothiol-dependent enzyme [Aeromicrobium massiliense]|uniref:maleylpyruvate isomerase family mycothiol-dependent enzyme n=1 Tax=Aeromicrobium massiliense TaxID=1464554 RepID=UPI0005787390|nr:maleylpyruvate isomerase family mycothiol-dependent enzyme [Aeromicrobium massiliense]